MKKLNIGMVGPELYERLADYADDDELWCCIITGAGPRAFSAGGNLQHMAAAGGLRPPFRLFATAKSASISANRRL